MYRRGEEGGPTLLLPEVEREEEEWAGDGCLSGWWTSGAKRGGSPL